MRLAFRHYEDAYLVSAGDIEAELDRIGHDLQPLDIVLVNTRAGSVYAEPGYVDAGCGMGREATLYLTERGVRVVGTDAWSWDAPFNHTAKKWAKNPDDIQSTQKSATSCLTMAMPAAANKEKKLSSVPGKILLIFIEQFFFCLAGQN